MMEVGKIRIADQTDFDRLRDLCEIHDGWTQVYRSNMTLVWTRANDVSDFNMVKVGIWLLERELELHRPVQNLLAEWEYKMKS